MSRGSRPPPGGPARRARLAVFGQAGPVIERRDAAENRARILTATRQLLATRPIQEICMDELAKAANVGKGTLYRRFADRAALCRALLGEEATRIQELVLDDFRLPAGATWLTRAECLAGALFDFTVDNGSLLSEARAYERRNPDRYAHPAYRWQRETLGRYIVQGIRAKEFPEMDPWLTADFVLAPLDPDLWKFHLREGRSRADGRQAFLRHVRCALKCAA